MKLVRIQVELRLPYGDVMRADVTSPEELGRWLWQRQTEVGVTPNIPRLECVLQFPSFAEQS